MAQPNPATTVTNPRVGKLIELEVSGRIKPEHQQELDTYRAQGLAPKKADTTLTSTEGERKASSFLTRAIGSNRSYEEQKVGPRGLIGQTIKDTFPNASNYLASDDRQTADSAQDEFIAASLRQDSGAAIPEQEMERQRRIYFPMPGDGDAVLKQKKEARLRAIDGLLQSAGRSVTPEQKAMLDKMKADIDAAISGEDKEVVPAQKEAVAVTPSSIVDAAIGDDEQFSKYEWTGMEETPEGKFRYSYADGRVIEYDKPLPMSVNVTDDTDAKASDAELAKERDAGIGPVDAVVRGAADTLTLGLSDEIAAAGDTIFNGGTMKGNLRRQRAIDATDSEVNPYLRFGGQLAGGAVLPVGRGAQSIAELAKVGGGLGAAYGFGSGTDLSDRLEGAGIGALSGATTGAAFGKLGDIWRRRGGGGSGPNNSPLSPTPFDIKSAADRVGVDVLPADVGGPLVGRLTAGAAQTPFGAPPILSKAARAVEQGKAARDSAASAVTTPAVEEYGAGRAAQRGLTSWIKKTDDRTSRLYDAISVEPKTDATAQNTRGALKEITQGMESNPELSRIWTGHPRLRATLEALTPKDSSDEAQRALASATVLKEAASGELAAAQARLDIALKTVSRPEDASNARSAMQAAIQKLDKAKSDIASAGELASRPPEGGNVSWEDMKRLRSIVGEIIGSPSLSSEGNENAAMRKLYAALSEDMRATAEASGPKALREFERANSFTRARESRIKNVLVPILGKDGDKGGQAAFTQIQNWSRAKGETARMAQMMRSLPKDEAETVSATLISNLGKVPPGRQGAAGNSFSFNDFLTHWNQLDKLAKNTLFTPGQRSSLEDLAIVAEGTKAGQRFANTSNTAGAIGVNATTGGLGGAMVALGSGHPLVALALSTPAIGQHITGRMMASPHFVRWLAKAPANPRASAAYIGKLKNIAAKDAALTADLTNFSNRIMSAMNDNYPTSAAASDQEQGQK